MRIIVFPSKIRAKKCSSYRAKYGTLRVGFGGLWLGGANTRLELPPEPHSPASPPSVSAVKAAPFQHLRHYSRGLMGPSPLRLWEVFNTSHVLPVPKVPERQHDVESVDNSLDVILLSFKSCQPMVWVSVC